MEDGIYDVPNWIGYRPDNVWSRVVVFVRRMDWVLGEMSVTPVLVFVGTSSISSSSTVAIRNSAQVSSVSLRGRAGNNRVAKNESKEEKSILNPLILKFKIGWVGVMGKERARRRWGKIRGSRGSPVRYWADPSHEKKGYDRHME